MSPIKKVVEFAGSQAALSRSLGVTPAMVSDWVSGKKEIAGDRALQMELFTKGEVTAKELAVIPPIIYQEKA